MLAAAGVATPRVAAETDRQPGIGLDLFSGQIHVVVELRLVGAAATDLHAAALT